MKKLIRIAKDIIWARNYLKQYDAKLKAACQAAQEDDDNINYWVDMAMGEEAYEAQCAESILERYNPMTYVRRFAMTFRKPGVVPF